MIEMIEFITKLRTSIMGALAYVRANNHDEQTEHELHEWRELTDAELTDSLERIDDFLDNNNPHQNN